MKSQFLTMIVISGGNTKKLETVSKSIRNQTSKEHEQVYIINQDRHYDIKHNDIGINGKYVMIINELFTITNDRYVSRLIYATKETDPDICFYRGYIGGYGILPVYDTIKNKNISNIHSNLPYFIIKSELYKSISEIFRLKDNKTLLDAVMNYKTIKNIEYNAVFLEDIMVATQ